MSNSPCLTSHHSSRWSSGWSSGWSASWTRVRGTRTLAALALLLLGAWGLAQSEAAAAERIAALEQQVTALQEQVASLEEAVRISHLLTAERYLHAAGFHAMEHALAEGDMDPGYLQTVQTTLTAVTALRWPSAIAESKDAFVTVARELESALQEQDVEAAAAAAERVHGRAHDLEHAIFDMITDIGPSAAEAGGQAHEHADSQTEGSADASEAAHDADAETHATVPEGVEPFVLAIAENGAPVGGPLTRRVRRSDTVAFQLSTQVAGALHLHGYNLDWHLAAGDEQVLVFEAESAGRFPLEFHLQESGRGIVVAYLEVHP